MTNLSASSDLDRDALQTITSLHHHFSGNLADAHHIDPATISAENPDCPRMRVLTRAQGEAPVRERVACTLLAAQISKQYAKALTSLYNHAWTQVEQDTGGQAEMAGWKRVVEATSTLMDAGLDAEIERLLAVYVPQDAARVQAHAA